jgi:hypothetical protein
MIEALVMHGKASHGYCGAMVNVIELARERKRADRKGDAEYPARKRNNR